MAVRATAKAPACASRTAAPASPAQSIPYTNQIQARWPMSPFGMRLTPSLATVTFTTNGVSCSDAKAFQIRTSSSRRPGPMGWVSVVMYGDTGGGGTPRQSVTGATPDAAVVPGPLPAGAENAQAGVNPEGRGSQMTAGIEAPMRTRSSSDSSPTSVYEIPPMFQCSNVTLPRAATVPTTVPNRTSSPRGGDQPRAPRLSNRVSVETPSE